MAAIAPERISFFAASFASFAFPVALGVNGALCPVELLRSRFPTRSRGYNIRNECIEFESNNEALIIKPLSIFDHN